MEEYDADINFHFEIDKENGIVNLTSDIDDQIDYLNSMERTTIIIHLMRDLFEQIFTNLDNLDKEADEEYINDICNKSIDVRNAIISSLLNFHYNSYAQHCKQDPKLLEFSMVIYEAMYNKFTKEQTNFIMNTTYSENITSVEPMSGSLAYALDTAENLLQNGITRPIVKLMMNTIIKQEIEAVNKFIDNYEEDE